MRSSRFAFALVLASIAGCSSSSFDVAETTDAPVDEDTAVADTSVADTWIAPDTSEPTDIAADTVLPTDTVGSEVSDGSPPACDPSTKPDETMGVFASPTGSDGTGDGTALKPLRSIGAALVKANALGRSRVYLDVGTYPESVNIGDPPAGVFVEGGWKAIGASWGRNCAGDARAQTVIASPSNIGVLVDAPKKPSGLRRLTVTTKANGASPIDTSGEAVFGVFIRGNGAVFTLENVDVIGGNGGNGGTAKNGIPSSTSFVCAASCSTGAAGAGSPAASGAKVPGGFGASGYTPADGSPGVKGSDGQMGTSGGSGSSGSCVTSCSSLVPDCTGVTSCSAAVAIKTAANGSCGCGGSGGAGGGRGRGGGAAVSVLIIGDSVDVQIVGSRLQAGNGGKGSDGGLGADGSPGSTGKAGDSISCAASCGRDPSCNCAPSSTATVIAGGTAGGVGGTGGRGGNGGAGAGGQSYALVTIGTAQKVTTTSVTLAHGTGGSGSIFGTAGDRFPPGG